MPLYKYQALDKYGKKRTGFIEAVNEKEAKDKLREQSVMVTSISSQAAISKRQNLKGESLLGFTLQLSQLVNAGVPLYESLLAIEEQYRNEPFHRVLLSICDQVKSGTSLSGAMAVYPDSFGKLYCSMVTAGESAGALDIVLERLSQYLGKRDKLRKSIATAMIYPGILAAFSLLVIVMLLGFVVPSIEGIFSGRQLNGFTNFVLGVSHIFRDYWWLYVPLLLILIGGTVYQLRKTTGRIWLQRFFMRLPFIKDLMIQAAIARFTRTMGTLQQGGLTMIDSLRIAREVMNNVAMEEEMKTAELRIIEGSSLSNELKKSPYVPLMVSRMLSVGEDSGSTVIMFNKIADMYEDNLEKTIDRTMALAQPVILIFMGVVIGSILLAILLPLTDISSISM